MLSSIKAAAGIAFGVAVWSVVGAVIAVVLIPHAQFWDWFFGLFIAFTLIMAALAWFFEHA
jgi:hypothetical protein